MPPRWTACAESSRRNTVGPDADTAGLGYRFGLTSTIQRSQKYTRRDGREGSSCFAQEALVKILDKVDTFRGESKFSTWAQKIAVRTALTELRRKRWENVSLQDMRSEEGVALMMPDVATTPEDRANPEESTSQQLLLGRVRQVINR